MNNVKFAVLGSFQRAAIETTTTMPQPRTTTTVRITTTRQANRGIRMPLYWKVCFVGGAVIM